MSLLRAILFESVVLLILVELVALAVALGIDRRRMTAKSRRGVLITGLVCALLLVIQHLVKTDRERIAESVRAMATAVDEGDVPGLGEYVADEFVDRGLNKTQWLERVRQSLQRWQIDEAGVGGFAIKVEDHTATVSFRATCDWRHGQQQERGIMSFWTLELVEGHGRWLLKKIDSAKIGPGGMLDYQNVWQY